jgi:SAM-dependent methyltransferase
VERPSWAPADINLEVPSAARMYDYYLGGMHNFAIDRQMADMGAQVWPDLPVIMRANRAFLARAVRYLAGAGIYQFLDVGSGIPTAGNVHEIVRHANPDARVAYVDVDPVAVAHSRAILSEVPHTAVVQADVRQPKQIIDHPEVRGLLDFDQPIGLLLVALLHFIPDADDPARIVSTLVDALPTGSYLVLSHFSNEGTREQVEGLLRLSRNTPTPLTLRPRAQVAAFFDGLELVDPGVRYLPEWRPDHPMDVDDHPERFNDFCGVGRKT